jgi:YARHG domain-containing protein
MKKLLVATGILLALGCAAYACDDDRCDELWRERNTYFKNAGYCFQTSRGIEFFGNGGCYTSNQAALRMSPSVRNRIAAITRMERQLGCN